MAHATKLHKQTLTLDNKLVEYRVEVNGKLVTFTSGETINNEILYLLENGVKARDIVIKINVIGA